MYTVGIRRDAYDEALRWINTERRAMGLPPLREIPSGIARKECGCPFSVALNGRRIDIETQMPMGARHILWIVDSHHAGDRVQPVRA
jgi:hypothetical protein